MSCQRCQGLMVCETFDDQIIETHSLYCATRCINCGCIEDAVIRANRLRRSESTRVIPCRRVRTDEVGCIRIHPEEYAAIT